MNNWEVCPLCNGAGFSPIEPIQTTNATSPCKCCNGARIIHRETGLPPLSYQYIVSRTSSFTNEKKKK